ncbi:MAG: hypothetical protein E6K99_10085 [Thaumarchaeota archaeon]|nr:MAG: hypothetical protein E6K99_10085 [Nitrososphaerota archaeon]
MTWLSGGSSSQELAENSVATLIDFASVLVAYNLGVLQLGVAVGLAYAVFDAYVVIWMRRRITGLVRRLVRILLRRPAAISTTSNGNRKEMI